MAFLTVFTPAYNRAKTLPRTFESLVLCQDLAQVKMRNLSSS